MVTLNSRLIITFPVMRPVYGIYKMNVMLWKL